MKCVLLAGGYGTRLGSLTKNKPKPLIKVGSKPVIGHIVDALIKAGVNNIITNLHYLPDKIPEYLGTRSLYYYEPVLLGHQGTISALRHWLDEDFLVINADTLTNVDYQQMIAHHKEGTITALMDEWRCVGSWIYSKDYFENKSIPLIPYRPKGLFWFDIGTKEKLARAKKHYDKKD